MLEDIAKILRDYKDDQNLVITEGTTFEELSLDSLDVVELVMKIEEDFKVSIEMDEELKSVGKLVEAISANKKP